MEYFLIFILILVGLIPILIEIIRKNFDLFNIKNSFIVYYLIQLGLSAYVLFRTSRVSSLSLDLTMHREYYLKALVAAVLGLFFFQLGYYLTRKKYYKIILNRKISWSSMNVVRLILIYLLVASLSFTIFLSLNGGIHNFLYQIEGFRAGGVSGQGFLMVGFTQLLTIACCIALASAEKSRSNSFLSLKKVYFLIIFSALPTFILGFRSLIILPFLSYIVVFNYRHKVIVVRKFLPIVLVVLVFFTAYGIWRAIPQGVSLSVDQVYAIIESDPEAMYSVLLRSKGIEVVAAVIKKLEETQMYDYGYKTIFEAFTILVPNRIWEGKPETSTVRFTTYFFGSDLAFERGYDQDSWGGISPTVIGDAFWNFGWFGVCLIPFILGFVYKVVYTIFIVNRHCSKFIVAYALMYPQFSMIPESLQGYLNGIVISLFFMGISFFLLKLK